MGRKMCESFHSYRQLHFAVRQTSALAERQWDCDTGPWRLAGIAHSTDLGWRTLTVATANFTGVNNLGQNAILIRDPFAGGGTPDPSLNSPTGATCPTKVQALSAWFEPSSIKNARPASDITGPITTAAASAPFLCDRDYQLPGIATTAQICRSSHLFLIVSLSHPRLRPT